MLTDLTLRDIVLVERLSLTFGPGLSALTGETGAGKSILLDGLGLALGARADSGLVRHGAETLSVTARFAPPPNHPSAALLAEAGIEPGEEGLLVLRRHVGRDGKSRGWVNDQPASASLLRRVGATLVEIHGQFDTNALLDAGTHRDLLDEAAGAGPLRAQVASDWAAWRAAQSRVADLRAAGARARAEESFLRAAADEIATLDPLPGEEARLAERRTLLVARERLAEALGAALGALGEGAERGLRDALRALTRVADGAPARIGPALDALDRAAAELQEAAALLTGFAADLEEEGPGGLESVEERLFALRALARKHGVEVAALPELRATFAERVALLEDGAALVQSAEAEQQAAAAAFRAAAAQLSARRQAEAGRLDAAVAAELGPLRLGRARFETRVTALPEAEWGPTGTDGVTFLVATNPGAPPGPLERVASGGELARFTLALKVVLAGASPVTTLIFDEVDQGIGGAVADAVGERLARLGAGLQVLAVTHAPQVAARAAAHLRVIKHETGGRAVTDVEILDATERREEIARMLSGAIVTDEARAAAARLLGESPAPAQAALGLGEPPQAAVVGRAARRRRGEG